MPQLNTLILFILYKDPNFTQNNYRKIVPKQDIIPFF